MGSNLVYRKNMEMPPCNFNSLKRCRKVPKQKINEEVATNTWPLPYQEEIERKKTYLVTHITYRHPLSPPPHNTPIKTQHIFSFWYKKIPKFSKIAESKMRLPYDLYVSLLLRSLILDPFLISNSPDGFGLGYMANKEVEVERQIVRTIIAGNSDSLQPNSGDPLQFVGITLVSEADMKGALITRFGTGTATSWPMTKWMAIRSNTFTSITMRGCRRDTDEGRRMMWAEYWLDHCEECDCGFAHIKSPLNFVIINFCLCYSFA